MSDLAGTQDSGSGRRRVFLGLGSNVGERLTHLADAVAAIPDVHAVSAVYETVPVGGPKQDDYLNLVVLMQTSIDPYDLLELCQSLEAAAQRLRIIRWGPRTLDVDILWIDGCEIDQPDLSVPHPRMFERSFVLVPLAEVGEDLLPDDFDVAVASLDDGVVRLGPLDELIGR